jgi:hypothetical protein
MAYDPIKQQVVMFGGGDVSKTNLLQETWLWNGTVWTKASGKMPAARAFPGFASDPVRQKEVLFGGLSSDPVYLQDTWEWNGTSWSEVMTSPTPPAVAYLSMAYDWARGRVMLLGGENGDTAVAGDLWAWDGTTWVDLVSPRFQVAEHTGSGLAYDRQRERLVSFGGYLLAGEDDATWLDINNPIDRPGLRADIQWSTIGVPAGAVEEVAVTAVAGGQGQDDSNNPSPGAVLYLWNCWGGKWQQLQNATPNAAVPTSPAAIQASTQSGAEAGQYLAPDGALHLAVSSASPRGNGILSATVAVDSVEVQLKYRSP